MGDLKVKQEGEEVKGGPSPADGLGAPGTAHTPTPWSVGHSRRQNVAKELGEWWETAIHCGVGGDRGNCLAIVYLGGPGALRYDEASTRANAAFIVRAVNAHEDAVKALRDMLDKISILRQELPIKDTAAAHQFLLEMGSKARAILSKLEAP